MTIQQLHAVTGAFGYSGKYIAHRLLAKGHRVCTLTNSLQRTHPFGNCVEAHPFNFENPAALSESSQGVDVLYNTYWVRFNHKMFSHADAVQNTLTLFAAAKQAGVSRIVHVSITNPDENSPLEYFRGKGVLEIALQDLGIPYSILRPTVLFGKEDILVNNIAWMLRTFPIFGVFGNGRYQIQPIYVDDLAQLAVEAGEHTENEIINAIGPETFTYREMVETVGEIIGKKRPIFSIPPTVGFLVSQILGKVVDDVLITREEIDGLMADLLYVTTSPTGQTHLTDWAKKHANTLGRQYTSELARRRNRQVAYASN